MTYQQHRIGDHCQVGDGAHGSLKRTVDGVPYLTAKDIKDGRIDIAGAYRIDQATFEKNFKRDSKALTLPLAGDVVFGIIGSLGQAYCVKTGDHFGMSSSIAMLRPNKAVLDSDYLYYWVTAPQFQAAIYAIKGGVAQSYISLEMIRSLPLLVPPLSRQREIVSALSAYDDLIENNARRITILEEIARRIYEEWFVYFRFPGHERVKMVESELGLVPEGWRPSVLADVLENVRTPTTAGAHLAARHYVPIDCIGRKTLALAEVKPWTEAQSSLVLFEEEDILFGAMRAYFHKVCIAPFPGVTRTTCFVLRPRRAEFRAFGTLTAFAERTVVYAAAHSQGATIPYAVWDGALARMPTLIPPEPILRRFDNAVAPMLAWVKGALQRQRNLRATRDLLLPKLISGELDVSALPESKALVT